MLFCNNKKIKKASQVSPGQCFQALPNMLDAALFIVLVAFSSFLSPPGSGHYGYGDDEDWYSRRYKGDDMLGLTHHQYIHEYINAYKTGGLGKK